MWRTTTSQPNARQYAGILAAGGAVVVLGAGLRSPAIALAASALGIGAVLVTDQLVGAGSAPMNERVAALPAHAAIEIGWLIGIAGGVIRRPGPRPPAT